MCVRWCTLVRWCVCVRSANHLVSFTARILTHHHHSKKKTWIKIKAAIPMPEPRPSSDFNFESESECESELESCARPFHSVDSNNNRVRVAHSNGRNCAEGVLSRGKGTEDVDADADFDADGRTTWAMTTERAVHENRKL